MTATIPAGILREILTGTLTSVSTDTTLPTLCCIQLAVTGNEVTAQSTDRYRAVFATYVLPDGFTADEDSSTLIDRKHVKTLLAALPKGKGTENLPVTMTPTLAMALVFEWPGSTMTVPTSHGLHPNLSKIIPANDDDLGLPGGVMVLSGKYLATMDAIPNPRNLPWHLSFHGASKPMTARRHIDGGLSWLFMLSPVKIN